MWLARRSSATPRPGDSRNGRPSTRTGRGGRCPDRFAGPPGVRPPSSAAGSRFRCRSHEAARPAACARAGMHGAAGDGARQRHRRPARRRRRSGSGGGGYRAEVRQPTSRTSDRDAAARNRDSPMAREPDAPSTSGCCRRRASRAVCSGSRSKPLSVAAFSRRVIVTAASITGLGPVASAATRPRMLTKAGRCSWSRSPSARSSRCSLVAIPVLEILLQARALAVQRRPSARHECWVIQVEDRPPPVPAVPMIVDGPARGLSGCPVDAHVVADVHPAVAVESDQPFVVELGGPRKIRIRVVPPESPVALGSIARVDRRAGEVQVAPTERVFRCAAQGAPVLYVSRPSVLREPAFAVHAK